MADAVIDSRGHRLLGLAVWIAVSAAAGVIGTMANPIAHGFYSQLRLPEWAPPGWLFGPVWSLLYVMMGIAAWLVWRTRGSFADARVALTMFLAQLVLNALWSWLFFAWRLGSASFVEIVVLWVLILATLVAFWRVRPLAGALLLPYLAWVGFASALTFATWQMNPELLAGLAHG